MDHHWIESWPPFSLGARLSPSAWRSSFAAFLTQYARCMGQQHPTGFHLRRGLRISAITALALLGVGGIIGYALGLPATQRVELAGPATTTEVETGWLQDAGYRWIPQDRNGTGRQAWGLFAATELDESIYLLVFTNAQTPEARALWRSEDGASWDEITLDFGERTVENQATFARQEMNEHVASNSQSAHCRQ